jgi:hypothetical protein
MKPLFLLKYCFIKDLKKNLATGCTDFTAGLRCSNFKEHPSTGSTSSPQASSGQARTEKLRLYKGVKLRVWPKNSVQRVADSVQKKGISCCKIRS